MFVVVNVVMTGMGYDVRDNYTIIRNVFMYLNVYIASLTLLLINNNK